MSAIIADYDLRGPKASENVLFQELNNNLVVIRFAKNDFYPFRHTVHNNQDVLVFK